MARRFYITTQTRQQRLDVLAMEGDDQTIEIDFSAWAEDNAEVTSATWSLLQGNASIDGQDLSDNVASARITTNTEGKSLIKLSATTGTVTKTVYLRIVAKDPKEPCGVCDYGVLV